MSLLRQVEVGVANGRTTPAACRESGITEQTYYRCRKEYGGLQVDQAKRLKELGRENGKLKRLAAELSLDKQILQGMRKMYCFCTADLSICAISRVLPQISSSVHS